MATALRPTPSLRCRSIVLLTRNKSTVLTLRKPRQQSGQGYVRQIYKSVGALQGEGITTTVVWLPSQVESDILKLAKAKAKSATRPGAIPQLQLPSMQSTTLNITHSKQGTTRSLPEKVRKHSKRIDTALPGKHTRRLYDSLQGGAFGVQAVKYQGGRVRQAQGRNPGGRVYSPQV
jgi:hypothetical protein